MVIFVSMNEVKNSALQPSNACVQHRKNHQSDKINGGAFNSERKKLGTGNQDLRTYIDNVKKDCTAYLEQNTLHFENVANITVNSDSITPHEKKMG